MESVRKARERMKKYPLLFKECHTSATNYARCVALKENVLKDDCVKEFALFKQCLVSTAKRMGTRL